MSAAADKDHMTVEDPLGSDEEEGGSEDEEEDGSGSGSEEEDDHDDDEDSGQLLKATLEARQAARAAGDHPLQQSFRAAAAQLLEKYATADKKKTKRKTKEQDPVSEKEDLGVEQGIQDEAEEEEEEGEEEEEESEAIGTAESTEEDEQDADSDSGSSGVSEDEAPPAESGEAELGDAQRMDRQQAHAAAQSSGQSHAGLALADDDVDDIPYTIAAPSSYAAFAQLAQGQGPARLALIIRRIRACNAIALATDNRRKLQASISPPPPPSPPLPHVHTSAS